MIKTKLLTLALSGALGVGGVTTAATQWHRFDGPTFEAGGNNGNNGRWRNGNNRDGNSRDDNSGRGNHFGIGSCGD